VTRPGEKILYTYNINILTKHIKAIARELTLSKLLIEEKSKGLGRPAPAAEDGFSGFEFLLSSER